MSLSLGISNEFISGGLQPQVIAVNHDDENKPHFSCSVRADGTETISLELFDTVEIINLTTCNRLNEGGTGFSCNKTFGLSNVSISCNYSVRNVIKCDFKLLNFPRERSVSKVKCSIRNTSGGITSNSTGLVIRGMCVCV